MLEEPPGPRHAAALAGLRPRRLFRRRRFERPRTRCRTTRWSPRRSPPMRRCARCAGWRLGGQIGWMNPESRYVDGTLLQGLNDQPHVRADRSVADDRHARLSRPSDQRHRAARRRRAVRRSDQRRQHASVATKARRRASCRLGRRARRARAAWLAGWIGDGTGTFRPLLPAARPGRLELAARVHRLSLPRRQHAADQRRSPRRAVHAPRSGGVRGCRQRRQPRRRSRSRASAATAAACASTRAGRRSRCSTWRRGAEGWRVHVPPEGPALAVATDARRTRSCRSRRSEETDDDPSCFSHHRCADRRHVDHRLRRREHAPGAAPQRRRRGAASGSSRPIWRHAICSTARGARSTRPTPTRSTRWSNSSTPGSISA